jgi:hypothetical protein
VRTFIDYVHTYGANLVPVIPAGASLAPQSSIEPESVGKVPGVRLEDGWVGISWRTLGEVTLKTAKRWDEMRAGIGFRAGIEGIFAIDVDLTVKLDSEAVVEQAIKSFNSNKLAVRRVDHPEHHKLLICARMYGEMPRSFDITVQQSDGNQGKVQFLGAGHYFNVHGIHPGRQAPYVWDNDPADQPLALVTGKAFNALCQALGKVTGAGHAPREFKREPERCTPEELDFLLSMIPNDDSFEPYDRFIAMGSAIYGASGGQPWGKCSWLDWCDQVEQGDPDKPGQFWETMNKARIGAETLYRWANTRQPQIMAKRAFENAPLDEEEADTRVAASRPVIRIRAGQLGRITTP